MQLMQSKAAHLSLLALVLIFHCDQTGSNHVSLHRPPLSELFGGLVNHNAIKLIQQTHVTCPKHDTPAMNGDKPVLGCIANPFQP